MGLLSLSPEVEKIMITCALYGHEHEWSLPLSVCKLSTIGEANIKGVLLGIKQTEDLTKYFELNRMDERRIAGNCTITMYVHGSSITSKEAAQR